MKVKKLFLLLGFLSLSLGCNVYRTDIKGGMFRELNGIFAVTEAGNLDLYRSLLPEPFSMPKRPLVHLFIVDYVDVAPWPFTPYQEGAVSLRCSYKGEAGWHVLTMPVTTWMAMKGGRHFGFPKYVADEIPLEQHDGNGWKGEVRHEGATKLGLVFTPAKPESLSSQQREDLWGVFGEPVFLLVPPGEGPTVQRITSDHVVPEDPSPPIDGNVRVTIDPEDPWAALFLPDKVALGTVVRWKGGANMKPEIVD